MKKKLLGIFVCMLLIATAIPAVGTITQTKDRFDYTTNKSIPNMNDKNSCYMPSSLIEWENTYGGSKADKLWAVQQTNDNGYIACGTTGTTIPHYTYSCPWVVKVDEAGNEEWNWTIHEFTYNDTEYNITYCWVDDVMQTADGGYLAAITALRFYFNSEEYGVGGLLKLDTNGNLEWMNIYGVPFEWMFHVEKIDEVTDGYIGIGTYGNPIQTDRDKQGCFFKTNLDGELQWYKHYNYGDVYDQFYGFNSTTDGGYILLGSAGIIDFSNWDAWMVKIDANGNEQWNTTFGGSKTEYFYDGYQTSKNEYIIMGGTQSFGYGDMDTWIVRTDANGQELANTTYGGTGLDASYGFDTTDDGGCLLPVMINAFGGATDSWILKLDVDGNLVWKEIYGGTGSQYFIGICSTSDGGCIASGILGEWDWLPSDALLVKYAPFPNLEMEINGGLGVKVAITNNGLGDAIGVPYDLTVTGGILDMINKTVNGTIDIDAGATESISSGLLFGLGGIEITVKVGVKEETAQGIQFLIFSIVS